MKLFDLFESEILDEKRIRQWRIADNLKVALSDHVYNQVSRTNCKCEVTLKGVNKIIDNISNIKQEIYKIHDRGYDKFYIRDLDSGVEIGGRLTFLYDDIVINLNTSVCNIRITNKECPTITLDRNVFYPNTKNIPKDR